MAGVWDNIGTNASLIRQRVPQAFQNNQAFLALPTPITAGQAQAQLIALTRQYNGLLRLLFDQVDQIDDT